MFYSEVAAERTWNIAAEMFMVHIISYIYSYHIIYIICYSRLNIRQPKVDVDLQNKINPNYNQNKSPRNIKPFQLNLNIYRYVKIVI